jgi:hypothetical protein
MPVRPPVPTPSVTVLMARTLAAERGIFKIEELHRKLQPYDIQISSSQLGKVLRNKSQSLDVRLLAALRDLLDVTYDQLLVDRPVSPQAPQRPSVTPARRPSSREKKRQEDPPHDSNPPQPTPPKLLSLPKRS